MIEEWKIVSEFPDYSVSNYGRVKRNETNHILSLYYPKGRYAYVCICSKNKKYNRRVHRLVAIAFIPNPLNKEEVNHKDYDIKNNRVDNLEWMTKLENMRYSSENISKAKKGKKISDLGVINIVKAREEKNKNHHIYYLKKRWVVKIAYRETKYYKSFSDLREAKKYRNKILRIVMEERKKKNGL